MSAIRGKVQSERDANDVRAGLGKWERYRLWPDVYLYRWHWRPRQTRGTEDRAVVSQSSCILCLSVSLWYRPTSSYTIQCTKDICHALSTASSTPAQPPGTLFHQTFITWLIRVHSENGSRMYFLIVLTTDYNWLLLALLDESYSGALQISLWLIYWLNKGTFLSQLIKFSYLQMTWNNQSFWCLLKKRSDAIVPVTMQPILCVRCMNGKCLLSVSSLCSTKSQLLDNCRGDWQGFSEACISRFVIYLALLNQFRYCLLAWKLRYSHCVVIRPPSDSQEVFIHSRWTSFLCPRWLSSIPSEVCRWFGPKSKSNLKNSLLHFTHPSPKFYRGVKNSEFGLKFQAADGNWKQNWNGCHS